MSFLPSLPKKTNLADVLKRFPKGWAPLLDAHDGILRGESPLSIAERELIAAYVSGLNECKFCYNAHTVYAEAFGIAGDLFEPMMRNPAAEPVPETMRPILAYARLLTLEPAKIGEEHVQAILKAGWPEEAVADTAMVTALFNFMNRIVIGFGVDPFEAFYGRRREAVRAEPLDERRKANDEQVGTRHYYGYGKQLGIVD